MKNKKSTIKEKKSELEKLQEECDKNLEGWQRAKADYANLEKRTADEKTKFAQFANASLILELLQISDNFQSAYGNLPKDLEGNNWVEGIRYIKEQMEKFLKDNEVKVIKSIGEKFDPGKHEAVERVKSDKGINVIVEEVLAGYTFKGEVIRPARVKVSLGKNVD